jgi:hypothetical protein
MTIHLHQRGEEPLHNLAELGDAQNDRDFTHTERMHGACVTPQRLMIGDTLGRVGPAARHIHGMLFQHRRWIGLLELQR